MSMEKDIAIKVENVSKTFRIPHEKINSLKSAFVNVFHDKGYEEFQALDDVSFEVKKGEFFGIIGRNGSGKSTLLKILAGIYPPDKGKIKIDGLISPFLELGIGFNPELSGRDNIYLNATVLGLTKKQIDEKFDDIVDFSELRRFIDQKIKNYSSGMQVRLAFSVAIHANRDILLMDEVLAVGDTNFQSKCFDEFNSYRKHGKTILLVTHDIFTARKYCDRALLLRNGKIVKIGDTNEVVAHYINENISDKEKEENTDEQKSEKKEESEKINGRRKAQIVKIELIDENCKTKNIFEVGEKVKVRVICKIFNDLDNPIFGIIISGANGIPVFVTNTQFKNIKTGKIEKGEIAVDFIIENYLSGGSYQITPAIANKDAKIYFDWKDNFRQITIMNKEYSSGGIVDLKHDILIKKQ
jgi:ABC-type polysaccharide/polyol phosphate transport system ATPase subunit